LWDSYSNMNFFILYIYHVEVSSEMPVG